MVDSLVALKKSDSAAIGTLALFLLFSFVYYAVEGEPRDNPTVEQFKAVLALGVLAGILALIQFWNSGTKPSLLSGRFANASPFLTEYQSLLVLGELAFFGFYLTLEVLATALAASGLTSAADGVFLAGGLSLLSFLVIIPVRAYSSWDRSRAGIKGTTA